MAIESSVARTVTVRIYDAASARKRGKPRGAVSALVYSFVGSDYPSDPSRWQFSGVATRDKYSFTLPSSAPPGAQVWVCAAWTSRRGEIGPPSEPVTTFVQGGMALAA